MTEQELQAIKERVAAATPGPWFWDESRNDYLLRSQHNHDVEEGYFGKEIIEATCSHNFGVVSIEDEDANFIAHARQDVPALIEEVERYKQACEIYERAAYKACDQLTDANSRIEQLEDILSTIKDYAASYAEFNPTYENIVKMCEEGEGNEV